MKKLMMLLMSLMIIIQVQSQEINRLMMDPDLEREVLIGQVNESGLEQSIFVEGWEERVDIYAPDKAITKKLKKYFKKNADVKIVVFFASWCGDSKEHMPNFVKLVHKAKIKNVSYYALSSAKSMPAMDEEKYQIEYVPTFIVYRADQEIGRIVETPEVSLEKDLWEIFDMRYLIEE